jgi:peptidoglycan hydrolase-like protein with peptidoglycan-binding domain
MRFAGVVVAVSIATLPAAAFMALAQETPVQTAEAKKKAAPKAKGETKKAAPKAKDGAKKDTAKKGTSQPVPGVYASLSRAERAAIQFDLNWTGHYTGQATGEFNGGSVAAVRAFQASRSFRETGTLTPAERTALAAAAQARQERVGWQMVEDRISGATLGVPMKQAPNQTKGRSGTRWQSAQGQVQIETFRIREPGATLATVFEDQKREPPSRRLDSSALRGDHFVLSGMQGLKKLVVRAEVRDLEIRGVTVLYDQAIEGTVDHVAAAVLSAFAPFPGSGVMALIGPPARRKVEYGTGIVVTRAGHVLSDFQLTEGCSVLQVAGHGDASRIAAHDAASLALLRVAGGPDMTPAALVHEGARASDLTLIGIPDPEKQGGERHAITTPARLNGGGIAPPPQLGFAGAAALDSQGRFFGMVALKGPVLAGASATELPPATVVTVDAIRKFLDAQYVTPATGNAGADAAKASVVRVICVRR